MASADVEGSRRTSTQEKSPETQFPLPLDKQGVETQDLEVERKNDESRRSSFLETADNPTVHKSSLKKMVLLEKRKGGIGYPRPLWPSKVAYIFALLGFTLRAVNLWRFTYLWLHNGGWSFFIIYVFLLFLIGIPLLFLEMAVGQRMRQCSFFAWAGIGPWFGTLELCSFMVCFITALYFMVANSWTFFYLGQSFQFSVPWQQCPLLNGSGFDPECARTTPSMYFWYRTTLKASDRIEDRGPLTKTLFLPLLSAWCSVGIFIINGIKVIARVEYVMIPLAGIIIVSFLIRSLLLTGARYGLQHLTIMTVSHIYSMTAWGQAGVQVLFSLGIGYSPIVIYSSYMDQSNNCLKDAFTVALLNLTFTILATPFILCVLGFWATVITRNCIERNAELLLKLVFQGKLPPEALPPLILPVDPTLVFNSWLSKLAKPIKDLVLKHIAECNLEKQFMKVSEGPNFAFLAFVEAMSFIPGSVFWSIIFFLLLLLLQLNVVMGLLQSVVTILQDTFAFCRNRAKLFIVFLFGLMFLCSIFFIGPAGIYYITLLANYWMIPPILFIIIFENVAVSWAYGSRRFLGELASLWNRPIHPIYHWLWCYVCPAVLLVLFIVILSFMFLKSFTYVAWDSSTSQEVLRPYPSWAVPVMVFLFLVVILPIPLYSVYSYIHKIPFKPRSLDSPLSSSGSLRSKSEDQSAKAPQGGTETTRPLVV